MVAIVYFLVALGLTRIEVEVVVGDASTAVRIVAFVLLVLLSVTMLMLGSDSVERGLEHLRGRRKTLAGRILYWLTTSIVAPLELPVDYLLAIRDRAVQVRGTPTPRLIPLDQTAAVSAFKGNWGPDNNLRLFGIGRVRTSAGPQAPEQQAVSQKPFKNMLCNSSWLNPGGQLPGWVCRAGR